MLARFKIELDSFEDEDSSWREFFKEDLEFCLGKWSDLSDVNEELESAQAELNGVRAKLDKFAEYFDEKGFDFVEFLASQFNVSKFIFFVFSY